MARTIKGINVKIGAETTGLKKALKDVDKRSRSISRELRKVNRGLRFNPDSTELLSQKQDILEEKIQATSKRLKTLKEAQEDVEKQFKRGDIDKGQYRAFKREIVQTESKLEHFNDELDKTNRKSRKLKIGFDDLKKAGNMLKTGMEVAGAAIAAVGTAAGVAVKQTADYAKEVRNGARAADASVEDYQNLSYVLKTVGIDADEASELLVEVNRVLGEAKAGDAPMVENLNALGMSVEDLKGMGTYELFVEITDGLRDMEDQSTKTAVAGKLFGEDLSRKLLPALNSTNGSIEDLVKEAEGLDIALDEEEIESWQEFNETSKEIAGQFQALKREFANEFLPFLQYSFLPYIKEDLIPVISTLTNKVGDLLNLPFSYQGGEKAAQEIKSIESLAEAESTLAEKRKELKKNKLDIAGLAGSGRNEERKELVKEQKILEDQINLLEYQIKNWDERKEQLNNSTNTNQEGGSGGEENGEEKTPDEILENEIEAHKRRVKMHKETRESYRAFLEDKLKMTDKYSQKTISTLRDELKELNQEQNKIFNQMEEISWEKPSEDRLKKLMRLENWDREIAEQAQEELRNLSIAEKKELKDIKSELKDMEGTVQEGSERWDNLQMLKTQITEKYERERKKIYKKYDKEQMKLQDEIMENKFENNKISLKRYRQYLEDRLGAYKKHTDEWEKVHDKIENLKSGTGESDEFEPIKFDVESPSDEELDKLYPELDGPPEDIGAKGVMDQYNKKLDKLKRKNEVYGESFDFASKKANLLKETINQLIELPGTKVGLNNNILNNLLNSYKELTSGGETESLNWMTDAFVDVGYEIEEANKAFNRWKNNLVDGLTDAILRGEDLGDTLKNIADQMAAMAIKEGFVKPIVNWGLDASGLQKGHEGAYVSPRGLIQDMQKFHDGGLPGLRNDEQAIITQTGERILSREQNDAYEAGLKNGGGQPVININAVDAQSFVDMARRNSDAIVEVVGRDILENGKLKNVINRS